MTVTVKWGGQKDPLVIFIILITDTQILYVWVGLLIIYGYILDVLHATNFVAMSTIYERIHATDLRKTQVW